MRPEAQQIAIAEACGLTPINYEESYGTWTPAEIACIPDYPSDLNAMHEAEKVLTFEQWVDYSDELFNVATRRKVDAAHKGYEVLHATAAQRAEAFLRTLNLWNDTK